MGATPNGMGTQGNFPRTPPSATPYMGTPWEGAVVDPMAPAATNAAVESGGFPLSPTPSSTPSPTPAPKQETGLFSQLGSAIKDYTSNPANMARLAAGFNSMRLTPDAGIARIAEQTIAAERERKSKEKKTNQTVEVLRKLGRDDLADAVESNPSFAEEAFKEAFNIGGASRKSFAPRVDPATGEIYVPEYDPSTGTVNTISTGRFGMTPQEEAELENQQSIRLADIQRAQEAGASAFQQAGKVDGQIRNLYGVIDALNRGAETGLIRDQLPAFDSATADLRAFANTLGIDVINMATFGALSEAELKLALSTGLPRGLDGQELRNWAQRKIDAQFNLRNELYNQARMLASGQIGYSDYIKSYDTTKLKKTTNDSKESSIDLSRPVSGYEAFWNQMTEEEKRQAYEFERSQK